MSQPVGVIPSFMVPVPLPRDCPLGIGFIGAGSVVNSAHLPQYRKAGYRVVGCADRRPEALEATQQRWNLAFATTDYRRLLERPHHSERLGRLAALARAPTHRLSQAVVAARRLRTRSRIFTVSVTTSTVAQSGTWGKWTYSVA